MEKKVTGLGPTDKGKVKPVLNGLSKNRHNKDLDDKW